MSAPLLHPFLDPERPQPPPTAADWPAALSSLVGRAGEIDAVASLLLSDGVRAVTLTGPGGVGKTRLALAAAGQAAKQYEHGPWLVALAEVDEPDRVIGAIAQTLGIREAGDRPLLPVLAAAIPSGPALLVLDNIERVVAAAPAIADLLAACPALTILSTGREPWRLSGEHQFPLAPLPLPSADGVAPDATLRGSAVQLFAERAQAADPSFALTTENRQTVRAICAHLDGLPLAIELAAARVGLFPPGAMLDRLRSARNAPLDLLGRGARDLPPRQRTLRDAIAWSYDLLSAPQQALFRRAAVFAGGFSLPAAAAILAPTDHPDSELLDGLTDLAEKNLLVVERSAPSQPPRFALLTTIRAFATELLAASGEHNAVNLAHQAFFSALAAEADARLLGPDLADRLDDLEREHDNLRAALRWAEARGDAPTVARMAADLARFWRFRWHHGDGRHWLDRAVAAGAVAGADARAKALLGRGTIASMGCDYDGAAALLRGAVAAYRANADRAGTASALLHLGEALQWTGDATGADRCFAEALTLLDGEGERPLRALVLKNVGELALRGGNVAAAAGALGEALGLCARAGFAWGRAEVLLRAAELSRAENRHARAAAELAEAITLYRDHADPIGIAGAVIGIARAAAALGLDDEAATLYAAATATYRAAGLRSPLDKYPTHRTWCDEIRRRLGPETADAAEARGAAWSVDEMTDAAAVIAGRLAADVESALGDTDRRPLPAGLSGREVEVLRLVATGLTNAQVAERLFLSPRTINAHLNRIYAKLDVPNRAAAARQARDLGLA